MAKEKPAEAKALPPLWACYRVRLFFTTQLCGQTPADPEIMKPWLESRQPRVKPVGGKSIDEIQEEVFASLADQQGEEEQLQMLVFQRHGGVCVMRAATIKAHLKDCARVLSAQYIGKIQGERAFSTRMANGVYPDPAVYWLPILRPDGTPVMTHDGERDKPIHVRGPNGQPQSALKRLQFIEPARIDLTLLVLGKSVSETDLEHVLRYGGVHGYAGERGDGEGKYYAEIEKLPEQEVSEDGRTNQSYEAAHDRGSDGSARVHYAAATDGEDRRQDSGRDEYDPQRRGLPEREAAD